MFGPLVSAHITASSKVAMMIQTPARTLPSDKRILLLKLVVTKSWAETKASFQYQWPVCGCVCPGILPSTTR